MTTVRNSLVQRLEQDLIGPDLETELISDLPSDKYLSGILFPMETKLDPEEDDELRGAESDGEEASETDGAGLFMAIRPASAGLSFAVEVEPGHAGEVLVALACGIYSPVLPEGATPKQRPQWQRTPAVGRLTVPLDGSPTTLNFSEVPGAELYVRVSREGQLRFVTLTAVNRNKSEGGKTASEPHAFFQVELKVVCGAGSRFAPRPSRRMPTDDDGRVAELIYRDAKEYAVGHTCSARWTFGSNGEVSAISSTWSPTAVVCAMKVDGDVEFAGLRANAQLKPLSASWLASANDEQLVQGLNLLTTAYGAWLTRQASRVTTLPASLHAQAMANLQVCRDGLSRMEGSIALITSNANVRTAFRLAQQAMVIQRRWVRKEANLVWRPFQLGFQLLSLESLAIPSHSDRQVMDLLWFPTGGGKTEAYLALTGFILFLRRIRNPNAPDEGEGVAVLMRYTLRLLTIQQFQRASAMVLACEHLRRGSARPAPAAQASLGAIPFSIGLWVGGGATPNTYDDARRALSNPTGGGSTPRQLVNCPACEQALTWRANHADKSIRVSCQNASCEFGQSDSQLPVWTVDSDVYRQRPSLVIATVDKFAQLARNLSTGALFGRGPHGGSAPDLIIQDELHLISGPLGTITGLYEMAVDYLCQRGDIRPKIIGSTATIRRAADQIHALFDRDTYQFPPSCIDASNSGFALEDRSAPGRLYMGVTTAGRSPKFTLQAVCGSLLQAASAVPGTPKQRDPYWTLVAYFNSLRELGGAVVLMLDDVSASIGQYAQRRQEQARETTEPVELTSGVPSSEIPERLEQLLRECGDPEAVDTLLASNMISVGVDVPRLGLMVVNGQPKTMSEYIQATSRVGREFPGVIVSIYNQARVRDRSHFETFTNWHSTLYRDVEATSVTPFASRARDKALPAVLVAMVRHLVMGMDTAFRLDAAKRALIAPLVEEIERRAERIAPDELSGLSEKLRSLLDEWQSRNDLASYWDDSGKTGTLLMSAEQFAAFGADGITKRAWAAPNSMREVEPGAPYRLKPRGALPKENASGDSNG
jgi:hypothetical protein